MYFASRAAHVSRFPPPELAVAAGLLLAFLGLVYASYFTGTTGQTLGKMVTGLRVLQSFSRPGLPAAFLRAGAGALGILSVGLGQLPMMFDPARRALHDRFFGTRVVKYRANRLDIWRRRGLKADAKAPVLVNVPGGAWVIGMRRPQAYPLMGRLAAEGWICVSVGYRVSPRHSWPDHIVDVKRALAWVRENIADYGGDPDWIAISGGSAGGHLAALCALTPNDPAWQPGFTDADTSVVAAAPLYGRYDWVSTEGPGRTELVRGFLQRMVVKKDYDSNRDVYEQASPIHRIHADAPPFFVLHGSNDSIIPVGEARDFVAALRAVSESAVAYAEIPGAQHAFEMFGSSHGQYSAAAVARFLDWVRATAGYGAIAFSTTVSFSESPAARRISTNSSTMAWVTSCASSTES